MSNIVQLQLIPKPPRRKSRLPDDWEPSEDNITYALRKGMTERQARQQAELFVNYWLGCGRQMLDWNRVWQTWVLNSMTRFAGRGGPARNISPITGREV